MVYEYFIWSTSQHIWNHCRDGLSSSIKLKFSVLLAWQSAAKPGVRRATISSNLSHLLFEMIPSHFNTDLSLLVDWTLVDFLCPPCGNLLQTRWLTRSISAAWCSPIINMVQATKPLILMRSLIKQIHSFIIKCFSFIQTCMHLSGFHVICSCEHNDRSSRFKM